MMNQAELDFGSDDPAIIAHFERLEREARREFSEERLCIAWVTSSDGRAWQDWWQGLPKYERSRMLADYRFERAAAVNRGMRPYSTFCLSPQEAAENQGMIDRMAQAITDAAVANRPMPFAECPEMSGSERLQFQARLRAAMKQVGVVIVQPSEPANNSAKKKRS